MNDQISFIGSQIIRQNSHNRAGAEIRYAEGGRKKLLVKFTNRMQQSWIGQFERDDRQGISKVFDIKHTSLVLVIAGGRGYLVDIETKDIRRISNGCRSIVSVIKTTFPEYYIAGTSESLYVINRDGIVREILPDFKAEGFYLDENSGNVVSGILESDINEYKHEIPFKLDLDSMRLLVDY